MDNKGYVRDEMPKLNYTQLWKLSPSSEMIAAPVLCRMDGVQERDAGVCHVLVAFDRAAEKAGNAGTCKVRAQWFLEHSTTTDHQIANRGCRYAL